MFTSAFMFAAATKPCADVFRGDERRDRRGDGEELPRELECGTRGASDVKRFFKRKKRRRFQ